MPATIDMNLVNEILDGDPVLLPEEAAAQLGVSENVLYERAVAGTVPSIQPGGPNGPRRYRQSAITRLLHPA